MMYVQRDVPLRSTSRFFLPLQSSRGLNAPDIQRLYRELTSRADDRHKSRNYDFLKLKLITSDGSVQIEEKPF